MTIMPNPADGGATRDFHSLLSVPRAQRDDSWNERFLELAGKARLFGNPRRAIEGPDGLMYVPVFSTEDEVISAGPNVTGGRVQELNIADLIPIATETGCGIAINPHHKEPDWIFTYGNLWSYREFGSFILGESPEVELDGSQSSGVLVTSPSEEFLPAYARRVLRDFLKDRLLCNSPGVLLLIDGKREPSESLVFSVFPEDYSGEDVFEAVLQMIDWHLPPHYSFHGVPKDSDIARTFFPL